MCVSFYVLYKRLISQNAEEHTSSHISIAPEETCVAMETL